MSRIEIAEMKHTGWAWRCWECDRNMFGYGDDREKAAKEAAAHERRTHAHAEQVAAEHEHRGLPNSFCNGDFFIGQLCDVLTGLATALGLEET